MQEGKLEMARNSAQFLSDHSEIMKQEKKMREQLKKLTIKPSIEDTIVKGKGRYHKKIGTTIEFDW
jgi:hypothetical protein